MPAGQMYEHEPHSMQSVTFRDSSSGYSFLTLSLFSKNGSSPIGHALTHLAQRIHSNAAGRVAISLGMTSTPLVPFVTGELMVGNAFPIIGPPLITFSWPLGKPPAASTSWLIGVPTLTIKFDGFAIPSPVTVTILSINGFPF